MTAKYYAKRSDSRSLAWSVWQEDKHGDRRLAGLMSETTARKVARLLNDDYNFHANAPIVLADEHHGAVRKWTCSCGDTGVSCRPGHCVNVPC